MVTKSLKRRNLAVQEEFQDDPNLRDKNLEEEERYPISTEEIGRAHV